MSPSEADLAETDGSPACGAVTTPPLALFVNSRLRVPPVQRKPSPKLTAEMFWLPSKRMLNATGSSPEEVNCSESAERLGVPVEVRSAPPVPTEFWQPCPADPLL